jgi:hypothetical protein
MSIRNKQFTNIIQECDFYKNSPNYSNYILPWLRDPINTFNKEKRCRDIETKRLLYNPILSGLNGTNRLFSYKTSRPLRNRTIVRYELFNNETKYNYKLIILILLILFFIYQIANKKKYKIIL